MDPQEFLKNAVASPIIEVRVLAILVNVTIAAVLAHVLGIVYAKFGSSLSNRRAFARNFMLLACTTTLIITIVKSSLALSLGLVGALSIVRFRAAIKEPEELAYLFLTIAIGLGLGADQLRATVPAFALIVGVICINGFRLRKEAHQNLFLTVTSNGDSPSLSDDVVEVLTAHCKSINLRRFEERPESIELSFQVEFADFGELSHAKSKLRALGNSIRVSFVDNLGIL